MLQASTGLFEHAATSVVFAEPDAKFILIPDAALLFKAEFDRSGPDLILTAEDGHRTVVQDYFNTENPLPLMAPNGAGLQPDVVELLAGSAAPNQYAQAGAAASPAAAIGTVKTLLGNVSVMRNGVEVTLRIGDPVYKSDVIQTSTGSAVGVSFPDGTALHLTANARMALTDYVFDAGSAASNGAFFNLVEGTFSFVAGQVAKGGVGMKIGTPVATMGIRGTTGWVQQVATISATVGDVTYSFAVVDDQGTNQSGVYDIIDSAGNVIATVSTKGVLTLVSGQGPGQSPNVTTQPMTAEQLAFEQQIVQGVFNAVGVQGLIPRSDQGGDSTPPPPPPLIPQNYQYTPSDGTTTFTINLPGPAEPLPVAITITYPLPVLPDENHSPTLDSATLPPVRANETTPSGPTVAAIFGDKFHDSDPGASLAGIAVTSNAADPATQGVWRYSTDGVTWIPIGTVSPTSALVLSAATMLSFLPATNFFGVPPPLVVRGIDDTYTGGFTSGATPVLVDASAGGGDSPISGTPADISVEVQPNTWTPGSGGSWNDPGNWSNGDPTPPDVVLIDLPSGETVIFDGNDTEEISKLVNVGGGTLQITGNATLDVEGPALNEGRIEVVSGGILNFTEADVDNRTGARIEVSGFWSQIEFTDSLVKNAGKIQARDSAYVEFNGTEVHNDGTIAAKSGGEVSFYGGTVDNTLGSSGNGFIKAIGCDSVVEFYNTVVIGGTLQTGYGGVIVTDSGEAETENQSTVFDGSTPGEDSSPLAVTIDGHVVVADGSTLTLRGTIHNEGAVDVGAGSCDTQLVIQGQVILDGCGELKLDGATVLGSTEVGCNTLLNSNTIFGNGAIGDGCDSDLKLVNQCDGVVSAECGELVIDTGSNDVVNEGLLQATSGGSLLVYSNIDNECGAIQVDCNSFVGIYGDVCGGEARINGGTLEYGGQNNTDTTFMCDTDGTLVVGACVDEVGGLISGVDTGDVFRFLGIDFGTAAIDYCEDDGTLTVTDVDSEVILHLTTDYSEGNFVLENDGSGHAQIVVNLV
jgi:hypothetical protein